MFTGIVQHVGTVTAARATAAGKRLTIDLGPLSAGLEAGASVAVAGACLTAAAIKDAVVDFDVVRQTLARTTLGRLRAGDKVNLERSLRADGLLEGHLVLGHVDGLAEVRAVRRGRQHVLELSASGELTDQMVPMGSLALDGVSLTLADVQAGAFRVALIPTTLARTTLGGLAVGDRVNVETDILGKYVRRCLQHLAGPPGGGLTFRKLKEAGF